MRSEDSRRPDHLDDSDAVLEMLDDLELQAEGLHLAERALEVEELTVAHDAQVDLVSRLHASVGALVRLTTSDGHELHGRLTDVGADWVALDDGHGGGWFASLAHVVLLGGVAPRTVPASARPLTARLSLRAILRRCAAERQACALHLRGGRVQHGVITRVGADFVELRPGGLTEPLAGSLTVPLGTLVLVQASGPLP